MSAPDGRRRLLLVGDDHSHLEVLRRFGQSPLPNVDLLLISAYPDHHTPKAGVHAVRQGPVLWESLRAAMRGSKPPRYRPQVGFLSILNTCDGKALLHYKGILAHKRWAFSPKDWIDLRSMAKYKRLAPYSS